MTLSPKILLQQSTTLIMTPQLQQAIKLLQLSNQELDAFIEAELAENPLLERESPEGGLEDEPAHQDQAPDRDGGGEREARSGAARDTADLAAGETLPEGSNQPLDADYDNVWTNDDRRDLDDTPPAQFADWGGGGRFDGEPFDLEQRLSGGVTLREHLTGQINVLFADPAERMIAATLIDSLDEAGYLGVRLEEIAGRLEVPEAEVERVLTRAQDCDPPGVFARDLGECLSLQLRDRDRFDPAMEALVKNLDRLARREVAQLKRICGIDEEDLAEMVAEIRALDPRPGLAFVADPVQTVIPDIIVRAKNGGGWHIELNADTLPRVLVNQDYCAQIKASARTKGDREYIIERMQSANWLIKALHQRATTILKVATEIVRAQDAFLAEGVQRLRPLTLRDIADAIGMHESTVSRVTTNKFMATPRGVFELKYFFTTAIASSAGGDSHSAESVRSRIKALIAQEPTKAVLSDDKIVEILSREGIEIARRTVAKYREAMRIPSSVQRRREKALSLRGAEPGDR